MGFNYSNGGRTDYVEITAIPHSNLVTNGGFETNDFLGWTTVAASYGSAFGVYPSAGLIAPHSGDHYAGFGSWGGIDDTILQSLATIPGESYTFTFWLAQDSTGNVNDFTASWNGTPILALQNADVFGWTEYTFTETATSSSTTIQFSGGDSGGPGYYDLDDVSVTAAVPEPSTIAILLASAAGLLGYVWRPRRV
jgi:hypothetical protein